MTKNTIMMSLLGMLLATGCAANQAAVECPECVSEVPGPKSELDYTKKLEGVADMDAAVAKVKAALKEQGFGVITEIDMAATLKKKLDVEMTPYRILGACNPKLAHQAVERDKKMGLLLPCKVIIYQDADGAFVVSLARPKTVFTLIDDPELVPIADEVDALIRAVHETL